MRTFEIVEVTREQVYTERTFVVDADSYEEAIEIVQCMRPARGIRKQTEENESRTGTDAVAYGLDADQAYEQLEAK